MQELQACACINNSLSVQKPRAPACEASRAAERDNLTRTSRGWRLRLVFAACGVIRTFLS